MTIFEAAIQGIVQGFTEFLPISSSGHLLISQHILGVKENNLFFDIMLHIGTLFAVVAVYYKTIWKLIISFFEILKMIFKKEFSFIFPLLFSLSCEAWFSESSCFARDDEIRVYVVVARRYDEAIQLLFNSY